METIMKSDIFFFITTVFVLILTAIIIWAAYYVIKILKDLSDISGTIHKAVEDANTKVRNIHKYVKNNPIVDYIVDKIASKKKNKK